MNIIISEILDFKHANLNTSNLTAPNKSNYLFDVSPGARIRNIRYCERFGLRAIDEFGLDEEITRVGTELQESNFSKAAHEPSLAKTELKNNAPSENILAISLIFY